MLKKTKDKTSFPKISIITPSYNQASFLEQTIKSVLKQNYPNLEYFIIDGGSTDDSVAIIKKYAQKYPQVIKWQSKKDKGQVDALNQGLEKASGDIVAYINSDDYYLPGAFNTVVKYFQEHPSKLWVVGNCNVSEPKLKWAFTLKHLIPIHVAKFWLLLFNWINQPAVFLKKELINKVGKFNVKYNYAFDYDYWLRCLRFALPGRLNQNLAIFRIHSDSKGTSAYQLQFDEDKIISQKHTNSRLILFIHKLCWQLTTNCYNLLKT